MKFLLGVDGGNTKTLALIAREDGVILGKGRSGCTDIYGAASPAAAIAEIELAVEMALMEAGIQPVELSAGVFSLAGADWPEDCQLLEEAMRTRGYGREIRVVNDAMGALRAGSPEGTGVVVACATGAAVGARGSDGRVWHSSFWQQTQGAEHLGLKALRAVYRAELGIDPPTTLTERILGTFAARSVEEVLHARAALRVLVDERLVERSFELGNYFMEGLRRIKSPSVSLVRGAGLWIGIDLTTKARPFCEELMRLGVLCKETHDYVIRVAPRLVITKDEIDWALERFERVLTTFAPTEGPPAQEKPHA